MNFTYTLGSRVTSNLRNLNTVEHLAVSHEQEYSLILVLVDVMELHAAQANQFQIMTSDYDYTHFLVRHHIAHSTNFTNLVDLVVSCGARELQTFIETVSKNTVYTSRGAVVEFTQALGTWTEESLLKKLLKVPFSV